MAHFSPVLTLSRNLRKGALLATVMTAFLALPSHPTYAQLACELPPLDEPDNDGDECSTPNNDIPKNLGDCPACGGDTNPAPVPPTAGDPINYSIGNKYEAETDYRNISPSPLVIARFYNSNTVVTTNNLGGGWRSSYSRAVLGPTPASPAGTVARITRDDGRVYTFTLVSGLWKGDADVNSRLTQIPTGWNYRTANDDNETYDANGRLLTVTNRAGLTQTITYNAAGQLATVSDPFGRKLTYAYSSPGSSVIAKVTAPDGGVYAYGYDAAGNLAAVTYADGSVRKFSYANTAYPHALTGVTDEKGALYSSTTYDNTGYATSTFLAGGVDKYTVDYSYASLGVAAYTNPLGATFLFAFQSIAGVPHFYQGQINCPNCSLSTATSAATNDANGNVLSSTDAMGNITTYSYDTARNLEISRTEAYGTAQARTITTAWLPSFRLPAQITEPNRTTSFTYDSHGNMLTKTIASGSASHLWKYSYNANGQALTATDADGNTSKYAYDANGNVIALTNPLGQITRATYDINGRPLTITDPNGVITTLAYDARNRLISRLVGANKTLYSYDAAGNLIKLTLPDNSFITYSYDLAHRLTGVKDALGNSIVYTLDNGGNPIKTQVFDSNNTLSRVRLFAYDDVNRLIQEIGAQNQTTTYNYDGNSNRYSTRDPLGATTSNAYDSLNRISTINDANTYPVNYGYDANNNLLSVTDPYARKTTYSYDGFGNVLSQTMLDNGTTSYTNDNNGNPVSRQDARNIITNRTFDGLNRVTTLTYPASAGENVRYYYDGSNGGHNEAGRLAGVIDESGSTFFDYDSYGNAVGDYRVIAGKNYNTLYSFDPNNHVTGMTYPSGHSFSYSRNAAGNISGITYKPSSSSPAASLVSTVWSTPFLQHYSRLTLGNGLLRQTQFDKDGRLINISTAVPSGVVVQNLTMTYDAADNITRIDDWLNNTRTQTFGYDKLYRLTSATGLYGALGYSYDSVGNRYMKTEDGVTKGYAFYAATNRVGGVTSASGSVLRNLSYDADGNTVSDDRGASYAYNNANRVTSATIAGGSSSGTYKYNGFGQRVSKTIAGVATSYIYDRSGHLIAEHNAATGALVREYVYLDDEPIVQVEASGAVYYILTDHQNTPQKLVDSGKNIVWDRVQKPFGETVSIAGSATHNLRFMGQYFDAESGANYNMNRYYDPTLGRYTQVDPIGLAGGINPYVYVGGSPTRGVDPIGLVNLNLYPPGSVQWESSNNYNPTDAYSVGGHGLPNNMNDDRNVPPGQEPNSKNGRKDLSPEKLGDIIQHDNNYHKGDPVDLHSCKTGQGDNSFAQQLADILQAPVTGADDTMHLYSDGRYSVGAPPEYNSGSMRTFTPRPPQSLPLPFVNPTPTR